MKKKTLLIKQIRIPDSPQIVDVLIDGQVIVDVAPQINTDNVIEINGKGRLLIPSFIDCHTHLDKAYIDSDTQISNLMDAVQQTVEYQKRIPAENIFDDVLQRGGRLIEQEISNGTGTMRSHVSIDRIWGMEAFKAHCELRSQYSDKLDLQLSVPYVADFSAEFDAAAKSGLIDFIAGYPSVDPDYRKTVDKLFDLSEKYALPLDLHVDESDEPDISCFLYIIEQTLKRGMSRKVNCSHVTALASVPQRSAEWAIAQCALAGISVITLPSCNMFLMGRNDNGLVRRGITRIRELEEAGVNVAIASDNVRDPFRPFGNGDLLEEILFTCQVLSRGTHAEIASVFKMATENAAKTCHIDEYSIAPKMQADLVLLDAEDIKQATLENASVIVVIKRGSIVFGNENTLKEYGD